MKSVILRSHRLVPWRAATLEANNSESVNSRLLLAYYSIVHAHPQGLTAAPGRFWFVGWIPFSERRNIV
jgi:hypothetical protein